MRILVTTGIFPPDLGGPATYVPQMASYLHRRGHHVEVLTLVEPGVEVEMYEFRVVRLARRQFRAWRWLRTVVAIAGAGRRADVLFVNGLAMEAAVANLVLRKPVVEKVVGDLAWERAVTRGWITDEFETFQRRRYGMRIELMRWVRGWWIRQADLVLVPSEYLGRWVRRWGVGEDRVRVVPNAIFLAEGVPVDGFRAPGPLRVITVGRLVPWKHVDGIIRAVAAMGEAATLVVVGDGPERCSLEALAAALGVAQRVAFAGARSQSETHRLLRSCDVFVLNSSYEGMPHVVLEAMAVGLPVIATAAGGTPEVVRPGDTGVLIGPQDETALLAALRDLAAHPDRRAALSRRGRECAQGFAWPVVAQATEQLLRQAARDAAPRAG